VATTLNESDIGKKYFLSVSELSNPNKGTINSISFKKVGTSADKKQHKALFINPNMVIGCMIYEAEKYNVSEISVKDFLGKIKDINEVLQKYNMCTNITYDSLVEFCKAYAIFMAKVDGEVIYITSHTSGANFRDRLSWYFRIGKPANLLDDLSDLFSDIKNAVKLEESQEEDINFTVGAI
jgi:hypothetical protein